MTDAELGRGRRRRVVVSRRIQSAGGISRSGRWDRNNDYGDVDNYLSRQRSPARLERERSRQTAISGLPLLRGRLARVPSLIKASKSSAGSAGTLADAGDSRKIKKTGPAAGRY